MTLYWRRLLPLFPNYEGKPISSSRRITPDVTYLEMLRCKTRDYGIADRVRFVEEMPQSALPSLYAASDLVINVPQRDSIPVTLLEAAACQRALFATDSRRTPAIR